MPPIAINAVRKTSADCAARQRYAALPLLRHRQTRRFRDRRHRRDVEQYGGDPAAILTATHTVASRIKRRLRRQMQRKGQRQ